MQVKFRKAATMFELIIYMVLIGLALYPMSSMLNHSMKTLKENNDNYIANFSNFVADIRSDILFENGTGSGVSIKVGNKEIEITRLDGCKINYKYTLSSKQLQKTINTTSCNTNSNDLRTYVVNKIKAFNVKQDSITNNFVIDLEKDINNTKYQYIIYNKN